MRTIVDEVLVIDCFPLCGFPLGIQQSSPYWPEQEGHDLSLCYQGICRGEDYTGLWP